jgi:uncharacterized protein
MSYTLITGASTGIGKEFAILCAMNQENVILVARNSDKLESLANELRNKYAVLVEVIVADLSQAGAAKKVFEKSEAYGLVVAKLINNAGIGLNGKFIEYSLELQMQLMQLNMNTLVELTHLYANTMRQHGGGEILNIASTAAFQAGPYMAVYYASKAFVLSFSEAIYSEFQEEGITVTVLCPGATKTDFFNEEHNLTAPFSQCLHKRLQKLD